MAEAGLLSPYWRPYFTASSEVEERLVRLLETYPLGRGSLERGDYRHQEWNFELPLTGHVSLPGHDPIIFGSDSTWTVPSTARNPGDIAPTTFNRLFLELFEPILYFDSVVREESLGSSGHREAGTATRVPLWLTVLEVEAGRLSYSTFVFPRSGGVASSRGLFDCHRAYNDPSQHGSIFGMTDLLVEAREAEAQASFQAILVTVGEKEKPGTPARQNFREVTRYAGSQFTWVDLSSDLVEQIDEEVLNCLGTRGLPGSPDVYRAEVEAASAKLAKRFLDQLEQHVEWDPPQATLAQRWSTKQQEARRKRLNYLVWLRSLAVAGGPRNASSNFKAYLYFPVPDLVKANVHTVTAAFLDWPDPRLFLLLQRNLGKMFPRSRIVFSRREQGQVFDDFAHEIGDVLSVLEMTVQSKRTVKAWLDAASTHGRLSEDTKERRLKHHSDSLLVEPRLYLAGSDYIALWSRPESSLEARSDTIRSGAGLAVSLEQMCIHAAEIALVRRGKNLEVERLVEDPGHLDSILEHLRFRVFEVDPTIRFSDDARRQASALYRSIIAALHNSIGHSVQRLGTDRAEYLPLGLRVEVMASPEPQLLLRVVNGFRGSIRQKEHGTRAVVRKWARLASGALSWFDRCRLPESDGLVQALMDANPSVNFFETELSFPGSHFLFGGDL